MADPRAAALWTTSWDWTGSQSVKVPDDGQTAAWNTHMCTHKLTCFTLICISSEGLEGPERL